MIESKKNDYYVYEHIRLDDNTCFYVGKGRGNRANYFSRNKFHDNIAKKHGMEVKIIKGGLTEEDAYEYEKERIAYYVNEMGYGIAANGTDGYHVYPGFLTNRTFGGEGCLGLTHTEEWCRQHSEDMTGEKNPMYGVNVWTLYSEDRAKEIREKISQTSSGENNPMYGVSPKERMDEDTYKTWFEKTSTRLKNQTGSNNPNFGNDTLHKKLEANPELRVQYYSRPGAQNGRAKEIYVYDLNHQYLNHFNCLKDCAEWIKETYQIKAKVDSMRFYINQSAQTGKPYKQLHFSYKEQ